MATPSFRTVDFVELLTLEPHGPDTYVGTTAEYPWGGRLYGGQVVAQALRAAIATVDPGRPVHSLHSYFIRPGSPDEPVRFEVERLREGRSFTTRQVVARQSAGAILNLSASFQTPEDEADVAPGSVPDDLPRPDDPAARNHSWGALLERKMVVSPEGRIGYWIRLDADLPDDPAVHACGLAFMSDAAPSRPARYLHPEFAGREDDRTWFQGASLDHAVWFHRPSRADEWHWFDARTHGLSGARGLVTADAWTDSGVHAASIAQQVLLRKKH